MTAERLKFLSLVATLGMVMVFVGVCGGLAAMIAANDKAVIVSGITFGIGGALCWRAREAAERG